MKDGLRIWYFHHYATPGTMSGMARPFYFGRTLLKNGHAMTVFAASYLHYTGENLIEDGRTPFVVRDEAGVPFVFVRTPVYAGSGMARVRNMAAYFRGLFPATRRYAKAHGAPDVIIASSPHPLAMVAGLRIARRYGVPCLCEVRDFWPEVFFFGGRLSPGSLLGRALLAGEHWIYRRADALIFLKEGDAGYLAERGWGKAQGGDVDERKCFYINNGIDYADFQRRAEAEVLPDADLDSGHFTAVYAGAIRPVNRVDLLVDAARLLQGEEGIRILLYGDGSEAARLSARIEAEGIRGIAMKGYVEKRYLPGILRRASVNVLNYSPDQYNWSRGNSSNKLFEYMASGRPILSTVRMGYSPIERYGIGLTLDEATPQALAAAILALRALPEAERRRMGDAAREAARAFDYGVLTQKLLEAIAYAQAERKARR